MKDNFSLQAEEYAKYRPSYPPELFQFIREHVPAKDVAWDCATGNGQIAIHLAADFKKVYATDISEKQISHAQQHPAIQHSIAPAENSGLAANSCDLVTVGQAIHWFQFDAFYTEVQRVSKKNALLVLAGYDMPILPEKVNKILWHFYEDVLGKYWDPERRYIDEKYTTLPFPFEELKTPDFVCKLEWNIQHLAGYAGTWSALQHYRKINNKDPFPEFENQLMAACDEEEIFPVTFPILIKAAIIR